MTLRTIVRQGLRSSSISPSLLKFMSIESVMLFNHLIRWLPHFLLPSVIPSIRVFANESVLCTRWPKYWSFSISPSNEYSRLISLGLVGLISLLSKELSRVFPSITIYFSFSTSLSHLKMLHIAPTLFNITILRCFY